MPAIGLCVPEYRVLRWLATIPFLEGGGDPRFWFDFKEDGLRYYGCNYIKSCYRGCGPGYTYVEVSGIGFYYKEEPDRSNPSYHPYRFKADLKKTNDGNYSGTIVEVKSP